MKQMMIYIGIFIYIFFSCDPKTFPDPPEDPNDTITYPLNIQWESFYFKDTSYVLSVGTPIVYKDYVIHGCWTDPNHIFHIFIFDKDSGEILKIFDLGLNTISTIKVVDKYLIVPSLDGLKIFDLESLTLAKQIVGKYELNLSILGHSAYVTRHFGGIPYSDSSAIIKVDFPSFETEKIVSITAEEYGAFGALNVVSIDINAVGDTLLYGTMETWPWLLYNYNMSQDSFMWRTVVSGGDSYMNQPLFDEEYIYITNNWGAEAYDKFTGKMIWRTDLEGDCGYRPCAPILEAEKLYIKECGYHLYCLNANNGSIVWHNDKSGGSPSVKMVHHDGLIYYGSQGNYLRIFDMEDGKELLQTKSPYDNVDYAWSKEWQRFESVSPAIDVEKGVFYMPDRLRMFCFELWEK